MRGALAKELRGIAKDGKGELDREFYKKIKKNVKAFNPKQTEPKLEKNPRWYRSPLRRAKMPDGSGIYFKKERPLRKIGNVFIDLTDKAQEAALALAKSADRLPKFELRKRIERFLGDERNYVRQSEPEQNGSV